MRNPRWGCKFHCPIHAYFQASTSRSSFITLGWIDYVLAKKVCGCGPQHPSARLHLQRMLTQAFPAHLHQSFMPACHARSGYNAYQAWAATGACASPDPTAAAPGCSGPHTPTAPTRADSLLHTAAAHRAGTPLGGTGLGASGRSDGPSGRASPATVTRHPAGGSRARSSLERARDILQVGARMCGLGGNTRRACSARSRPSALRWPGPCLRVFAMRPAAQRCRPSHGSNCPYGSSLDLAEMPAAW